MTDRSARAFARVANTRIGLATLLGIVTLLGLWAIVGGHPVPGVVFLLLAAALGAQLWRTEMGAAPGASVTPPPTTT